ncbi:MAG: glycosyltransferase [Candidatus Woykebacteria bacterium]
MKPISPFGLPIGISIAFWSIVGLLRLIWEKFIRKSIYPVTGTNKMNPEDIAVILPAHNEELVIRGSIKALKQMLSPKQIYVAADGCTDKTYRRARMEGCHVSYLNPGRGKARALVYLLRRFRLFDRYKLIFILDADTRPDGELIKKALPFFNDADIGVVFAASKITWRQHWIPNLKYYFISYRERLNRMLQYLLIFGQTWKYTSVNYVIPGFCTIYRSEILKQLQIDTPGILIEDFNLAFQFHKKRLAKLGYHPSLIAWDQYPDNLKDYVGQVRRWNIGFFQTVRANGIWPSFFWLTLGVFSFEVIANSIFVLFVPFLLLYLLSPWYAGAGFILDSFNNLYQHIGPYKTLSLSDIFVGTFLIDYAVTVVIGLINRKPQFIIYGLFFFFMHFVVSLVLLSSIIPGFFGSSSGRWVPPTRSAEQLGVAKV